MLQGSILQKTISSLLIILGLVGVYAFTQGLTFAESGDDFGIGSLIIAFLVGIAPLINPLILGLYTLFYARSWSKFFTIFVIFYVVYQALMLPFVMSLDGPDSFAYAPILLPWDLLNIILFFWLVVKFVAVYRNRKSALPISNF